jgi:uncharacterized membrane protein YedE/YeeE
VSVVLLSLVFLGIGLTVGFLAQRSRMCFVAGLRDWILVRDSELLLGLFSFLVTVWLLTSALSALGLLHQGAPEFGGVSPGPSGGPASSPGAALPRITILTASEGGLPAMSAIVNRFFFATLAGGFLIGALSVIAGGCVMRQHVLCAQGDSNALFYLVGFYGAVVVYYAVLSRFLSWVYM